MMNNENECKCHISSILNKFEIFNFHQLYFNCRTIFVPMTIVSSFIKMFDWVVCINYEQGNCPIINSDRIRI